MCIDRRLSTSNIHINYSLFGWYIIPVILTVGTGFVFPEHSLRHRSPSLKVPNNLAALTDLCVVFSQERQDYMGLHAPWIGLMSIANYYQRTRLNST